MTYGDNTTHDRTTIYENDELAAPTGKQPRFVIAKIEEVDARASYPVSLEGDRYFIIHLQAEGFPPHEIEIEWRGMENKTIFPKGIGVWIDHQILKPEKF